MIRPVYPLLALLLAGALAACQSPGAPPVPGTAITSASSGDVERGRRIAAERCASCHSIERGITSRASDAPAFETLNTRFPADQLGERIRDGLMVDHPRMPLLVALTREDERALEAFLADVQAR